MNYYTTAKHIGKSGDRFSVSVAVLKRLRKMLGNEKSKISVIRLQFRRIEAVSVHSNDAVRILIDDITVGIHAESPHTILKLLRTVNYLRLI